jgi:hypothetical protein
VLKKVAEAKQKALSLQAEIDGLGTQLYRKTAIVTTAAEDHRVEQVREKVKTRFKINFVPSGKRTGKFEMDESLNHLISSGEGVNFTLINWQQTSQPA